MSLFAKRFGTSRAQALTLGRDTENSWNATLQSHSNASHTPLWCKGLIPCKSMLKNDEDATYETSWAWDDFGSSHEMWISKPLFGLPTFSWSTIQLTSRPSTWSQFWQTQDHRALCRLCSLHQKATEKLLVVQCVRKTTTPFVKKMESLGMDCTEYEFYLDLRKYGYSPTRWTVSVSSGMKTFAVGTKTHSWSCPFPRVCCIVSNSDEKRH